MELTFLNEAGRRLAATLLLPANVARPPVVVFAHGFGSGRTSERNVAVAERLVERGIAAFLIDFAGHGDSEGGQDEATTRGMTSDLVFALDALERRPEVDPARIGVNGSSQGGVVAVRCAAMDSRVRALVLRSVPAAGLYEVAARVRVPALVIAGELETPIIEVSRQLYDALGGERELVIVPGAGHLYEGPGEMEQAAAVSVDWFVAKLSGGGAAKE